MEERSFEELRGNIKKLKEVSRKLTDKIQSKVQGTPFIGDEKEIGHDVFRDPKNEAVRGHDEGFRAKEEEYKNKIAQSEQNISSLEDKIKNLTNEKNSLQEKYSGLQKENEQLLKKIGKLEKNNKDLEAQSIELSKTLEKYEHRNWIKFSLDLIYQFVIELERYFRTSRGMVREALAICGSMSEKNKPLRSKIKIVEEEFEKLTRVLQATKEIYRFKTPVLKKVSLQPVIDKSISKISPKVKQDIKIYKNYPPAELFVEIDEEMFTEVLDHVIVNSLESMENRGSINITAKNTDGGVYIEVSDTGHSVGPHLIEKVFNPFLTTKQGHIGLGLTRAYWIAQLNNTRIEISGEMHKGTTVKIIIPCN